MSKSIFLESHHIKNPYFGFGQFNKYLISALLKKNKITKDFNYTLYSSDKKHFGDVYSDNIRFRKYYAFHRYKHLRIRNHYDLWHSLNQNTKIEPLKNIKYLLTVHNITYIKNPNSYKDEEVHIKFQKKLDRSDSITYISNYAKKSTHKFFDVPKVPEYVIYNGNTILNFVDTARSEYQKNKPYLFTIGEITERKNFKSLLYMIKYLKDYNLIIAGKKSTEAALNIKKIISKEQLNDRVFLLGKVSEQSKIDLYKNCSAFVFPSLREGFGLPIIEAMYFNKPVFTSFNTSLPEIGGDVAFYWHNFDPKYMATVLENGMHDFSTNKSDYLKRSRKNVERFSWDTSADEYIKVYKRLLY